MGLFRPVPNFPLTPLHHVSYFSHFLFGFGFSFVVNTRVYMWCVGVNVCERSVSRLFLLITFYDFFLPLIYLGVFFYTTI